MTYNFWLLYDIFCSHCLITKRYSLELSIYSSLVILALIVHPLKYRSGQRNPPETQTQGEEKNKKLLDTRSTILAYWKKHKEKESNMAARQIIEADQNQAGAILETLRGIRVRTQFLKKNGEPRSMNLIFGEDVFPTKGGSNAVSRGEHPDMRIVADIDKEEYRTLTLSKVRFFETTTHLYKFNN